ncbi:hypothetical protein D3C84_883650 [compost metagenome]
MVAVAELIWMIEPPCFIASTAAWQNRNGPTNCRSLMRLSSSTLVSRKGRSRPQPVALTAISTRPPLSLAKANRSNTC